MTQGAGPRKTFRHVVSSEAMATIGQAIVDKLCQGVQRHGMATMNVSLPDPLKSWAEERTRDGRYSNVSDYVRDLIRRDQVREEAIDELQAIIDEGLASGEPRSFDMANFIAGRSLGRR